MITKHKRFIISDPGAWFTKKPMGLRTALERADGINCFVFNAHNGEMIKCVNLRKEFEWFMKHLKWADAHEWRDSHLALIVRHRMQEKVPGENLLIKRVRRRI